MLDTKKICKYFEQHKGQKIGTLVGVVLGIIFLFFGFWKMMFFAIVVGAGYFIGSQLDRKENVKQLLDNILLDKFMRK